VRRHHSQKSVDSSGVLRASLTSPSATVKAECPIMKNYPLLDVRISTPIVELSSATDELLDELADVVRAGMSHASPPPYVPCR